MKKQESIPFPFTPYTQQRDLMEAILDCFDSSGVGVFESPTGTGKSLSVICSAMYWLRKEENSIFNNWGKPITYQYPFLSSLSSSAQKERRTKRSPRRSVLVLEKSLSFLSSSLL